MIFNSVNKETLNYELETLVKKSELKAGAIEVTGITSTSKEFTVTFEEPMQNTSYAVNLTAQYTSYFNTLTYAVHSKTVNGFTIRANNSVGADASSVKYIFFWTAIPYNS